MPLSDGAWLLFLGCRGGSLTCAERLYHLFVGKCCQGARSFWSKSQSHQWKRAPKEEDTTQKLKKNDTCAHIEGGLDEVKFVMNLRCDRE